MENDEKYLKLTIEVAREAFEKGNYPVGAVLVIGDKIVGVAGNKINEKKSFVNHAENSLIIKFGAELAKIKDQKDKEVVLYSTLEPCIQCLGAAVTNHVDKICYIEKDPNGGACNLKHDNIGLWYKEFWPEISQINFSDEPKKMMIEFFKRELNQGNAKWADRMLKLLG
jgi:tRNA(adenine34) deaminase